jgi:DNA-binding MarR family transcriptional regulator/N-acetylglutamate synthase-like GNAT family acetyltransferase
MDDVTAVRAFNRFYTGVIGLLRAGLVDTSYSLTEARVLFELGAREACEGGELRRLLDLDAGYLSRILARFESDSLITRERSPLDGRRQIIRLTESGRRLRDTLDERSSDQIAELLGPLGEEDRRRLVSAMQTVQRLLGEAPKAAPYVIRPPRPGDLGWVVHRHGVLYSEEYGWDETFEALVAGIIAEYAAQDPKGRAAWVAEVGGEPVGFIACMRKDDKTAQLRLFLVEPGARGMGIGTRLVDECLRFARRAGYRRMTLWTYEPLADARRIYQRAGFTLDSEHREHAFGHDMVNQIWSREL